MKVENISPVIAAAGKGTRSKLDYPKCLFEIDGIPIINRILDNFCNFHENPTIITSTFGKKKIQHHLQESYPSCRIVVQKQQLGMGDAVLTLNDVGDSLKENILLIWGDIPFIKKDTILSMCNHFLKTNSSFTLLTRKMPNPYTIVKRDQSNKILSVTETREMGKNKLITFGERDLGLFIFKKKLVLDFLSMNLENKFGQSTKEHGFLYIIEHLVKSGYLVNSYTSTDKNESISFNSISDIKGFI